MSKNCSKELYLFQFDGINFDKIQTAKSEGGSEFSFSIPKSAPSFYFVGVNNQNLKPLILGMEEQVEVSGDCSSLRNAQVKESTLNNSYMKMKNGINVLKNKTGMLIGEYRKVQKDVRKRQKVEEKMKALDEVKEQFLDSLKNTEPFLGKILALNTYLSFQNNTLGYEDEIKYFAREYFRFANFQDEAHQNSPWIYEAFKAYTLTIIQVGLPLEKQITYLEEWLAKLPQESSVHKLAIGGILTSLRQKKHSNFTHFANYFIEHFGKSDPKATASLQNQLKAMKGRSAGGEAPDFTQNDPEGKPVSLHDFRGKVLLIDFWASWCGPCRRENPNVVRVYEKYKDKGFEILGVSLDRTRDRWLQAIEKDKLNWYHVSDLKGWKNEVAALYGVRSIPHTILLDAEGKIIATKLRGKALENNLKKIFGE